MSGPRAESVRLQLDDDGGLCRIARVSVASPLGTSITSINGSLFARKNRVAHDAEGLLRAYRAPSMQTHDSNLTTNRLFTGGTYVNDHDMLWLS